MYIWIYGPNEKFKMTFSFLKLNFLIRIIYAHFIFKHLKVKCHYEFKYILKYISYNYVIRPVK